MDQIEPGWLAQDEEAAWRASLQAQREHEKVRFADEADRLREMWE